MPMSWRDGPVGKVLPHKREDLCSNLQLCIVMHVRCPRLTTVKWEAETGESPQKLDNQQAQNMPPNRKHKENLLPKGWNARTKTQGYPLTSTGTLCHAHACTHVHTSYTHIDTTNKQASKQTHK